MATETKTFKLNLVSPEKLLYSKDVQMAVIPGETGDFGVLPNHEALISTLRPGVIEIKKGQNTEEHIFVSGGFAEVSDDICNVLSEEVIFVKDIDLKNLEQFITHTRETIKIARDEKEKQSLQSDLHLANAKFEIAKRIGRK